MYFWCHCGYEEWWHLDGDGNKWGYDIFGTSWYFDSLDNLYFIDEEGVIEVYDYSKIDI